LDKFFRLKNSKFISKARQHPYASDTHHLLNRRKSPKGLFLLRG